MRTFSIRTLLVSIAFVALSIVAIRYAGNFWAVLYSQLTVFNILLAAICAYLMRGYRLRPFLIGFALFGGVFFLLNYHVVLPEAVYETKTIRMY